MTTRRNDIDGLRGISIILVVLFHSFPNSFPGFFIGVDIFFVISGYVITHLLISNNRNIHLLEFYFRRVIRIFPALILIFLFCLIWGYFFDFPIQYSNTGYSVALSGLFLSNFINFFNDSYFNNLNKHNLLTHIWSLGIEEQFYIFYPLLLSYILNYNAKIIIFLIISFSFILANFLSLGGSTNLAFYLPLTRFWEIASGCLIAIIVINRSLINKQENRLVAPEFKKYFNSFLSLVGIFLIILFQFLFVKLNLSYLFILLLLPVFGACLIIISGFENIINRFFLGNQVFVYVGLISFPLYLWHWPLLSISKLLLDFYPHQNTEHYFIFSAIIISVILSSLTYHFIELPLQKKKNSYFILIILMIIIIFIGFFVYSFKGLGARFSFTNPEMEKEYQSIVNYNENIQKHYGDSCFLLAGQGVDAIDSNCLNASYSNNNSYREVVLWGDSHAAHLSPGIKNLILNNSLFKFTQLTVSDCPPVINIKFNNRPNCEAFNNYSLNYIKNNKPYMVILSANWIKYESSQYDIYDELINSISYYKENNFTKILLVGPSGQFVYRVPDLLLLFNSQYLWPEKLPTPVFDQLFTVDKRLQLMSDGLNIHYISPFALLCEINNKSCMVTNSNKIILVDDTHLSDFGSIFLSTNLFSNYLN